MKYERGIDCKEYMYILTLFTKLKMKHDRASNNVLPTCRKALWKKMQLNVSYCGTLM